MTYEYPAEVVYKQRQERDDLRAALREATEALEPDALIERLGILRSVAEHYNDLDALEVCTDTITRLEVARAALERSDE